MDHPMTCPECATNNNTTTRIGSRRRDCTTCNRFAQAVRRGTAARLKGKHPDEYERIRAQVERELYEGTIATGLTDQSKITP